MKTTTLTQVMRRILLAAAVATAATFTAQAETYYKVGSDAAGKTSFNGAYSGGGNSIGWSLSGNTPADTTLNTANMGSHDFVVNGNKLLRLPETDEAITFAGNSLTLDGGKLSLKKASNGGTRIVTIDRLSITGTSSIQCANNSATFILRGENAIAIAANATLQTKVVPDNNTDGRFLVFDAAITGEESSKIEIIGGNKNVPVGITLNSAAGFLGSIMSTDSNSNKFSLELNGGFGGTIDSLPTNTTNVLVNVDYPTTASGLRIATTTIPSPLKTTLTLYSATKSAPSIGDAVMTFPAGTTVDPAEFTVKFRKGESGTPKTLALDSVENGDGTISLVVVPETYYKIGNDANQNTTSFNGNQSSSIGWSTNPSATKPDAIVIMEGNHFIVPNGKTLRTGWADTQTFGGASLTIETGGTLTLKSGDANTTKVPGTISLGSATLYGDGGTMQHAVSNTQTLTNGNVCIKSGKSLVVKLAGKRSLKIASPLAGDADTTLSVVAPYESSSGAQTLELQSAADFLGTITGTVGYDNCTFILKLTGGFGGTIGALPDNTTQVLANYDGLSSAKGLVIAETTIPDAVKANVVFYSDTRGGLTAGDAVMTFPAGTTVDPAEFVVKFQYTESGTPYTIKLKDEPVTNGDGTISLMADPDTYYKVLDDANQATTSFNGNQSATAGWSTNSNATVPDTAVTMEGNHFVCGKTLRTGSGANQTFGGASLKLEANGSLLLKGSGSPATVTIASLIAAGGKIAHGVNNTQTLKGNIGIETGTTLTMQLTAGRTLTVESTLTGDDTTTLDIPVSQENTSGTQTLELKSAAEFLGAITGTKGSYGGTFVLKLTGGFGGKIDTLPSNTSQVLVNIDDATTASGLRVATTTIPAPLKTAVVLYSDTKAALDDGDVVMTFPAGTTVNPSEFSVKFQRGNSGAQSTLSLKRVENGDGTISLAVAYENYWTGNAGNGDLTDAGNWSDGVPTGKDAYISIDSAATLTTGSDFAPASIMFGSNCAAVTINGPGEITDVSTVVNLSSVSHTINAKVNFTSGINVKQNAASYNSIDQSHVTFAGGAYAASGKTIDSGYSVAMFGKYYFANTSVWTATESGDSRKAIGDNSSLYVPLAGALTELYVGNGAKVDVGDLAMSAGGRLSYKNHGEVVVTNVTMTGSGDRLFTYNQGTSYPSVFKFVSITNKMTQNWFLFGDSSTAMATTTYIGAGGLNFDNSGSTYCIGASNKSGSKSILRAWYSDFTIQDVGGGKKGLAFDHDAEICTDDENNIGRTITLNTKTFARNSPTLAVSGSGTLQVNEDLHTDSPVKNMPVTVTDTATLAFGAGATFGTGTITLRAGTTLALTATSSTFTALANSLKLPTTGAATIRIDGARLKSGEHEIATIGTGATANIALDPASTAIDGRRASLCVEEVTDNETTVNKLVLNVISTGTRIIVR